MPRTASRTAHRRLAIRLKRGLARRLGIPLGVAAMLALRLSGRKAGVALVYHAVQAVGGDPERELVPAHAAALFDAQVRHLVRHYRVVEAAELQDAARRRRRGGRFPVAITFDDDLRSHWEIVLPILERHRATATFFLCGASLDAPFAFWWERLQRAYDAGSPGLHVLAPGRGSSGERSTLHELGLAIEELHPAARARVAEALAEIVGPDPETSGLRREGVRALASAGMTIGFHTRAHDALSLLEDDADLARALTEGRDALSALAGGPVDTIAYPHGRADARVADAARSAGFRAGFTTRHIAVTPSDDPLLQGRIGPSLRSVGALSLQLAHALTRSGRRRGGAP